MEQIKVLVVEDDPLIGESLKLFLQKMHYEVCSIASNFSEALLILQNESPDIALIDIDLGEEKTGLDFAAIIREEYHMPFIFLTSQNDLATISNVKEVKANGFLSKPFKKEDVYAAIEMTVVNFPYQETLGSKGEELKEFIFVKRNNQLIKLKLDEISYVKSDNVYVEINAKCKNYIVRSPFTKFIEQFPELLVKVHRSYAVNFKRVEKIHANFVLVDNEKVPMSKTFRKNLVEKISIH